MTTPERRGAPGDRLADLPPHAVIRRAGREFEVPERHTVALQDSDGFARFLQEAASPVQPNGCALWFQVPDVDAAFTEWSARGVEFGHGPRKAYWGYGAKLRDPDGYLVRLWDVRSMKGK